MGAAERGLLKIVHLLLQSGADANLRDHNGVTAADLAANYRIECLIATAMVNNPITEHRQQPTGEPKPDMFPRCQRTVTQKCENPTCNNRSGFGGMKRCGRCKMVAYCSVQCQRANWNVHKKYCKLYRQFRSKKNYKKCGGKDPAPDLQNELLYTLARCQKAKLKGDKTKACTEFQIQIGMIRDVLQLCKDTSGKLHMDTHDLAANFKDLLADTHVQYAVCMDHASNIYFTIFPGFIRLIDAHAPAHNDHRQHWRTWASSTRPSRNTNTPSSWTRPSATHTDSWQTASLKRGSHAKQFPSIAAPSRWRLRTALAPLGRECTSSWVCVNTR